MGSEILAVVEWSGANDLHTLSHVTGPRPFLMNVEQMEIFCWCMELIKINSIFCPFWLINLVLETLA